MLKKFAEKPILLLLAINILIGLSVFRNYGLSWDEPLFYDYGDALGYAYSPRQWFSGNFDVNRSFGPSGDDHKTRGPAYLLLAREPVYLLEGLGLDEASAWHLINFLFFQLGIYFFYRLAARWLKPFAALAASALFSWQPLLWGHAFINPKDPPFLTFFLASVCLGFEMVDKLSETLRSPSLDANSKTNGFLRVRYVIFPAVVLGVTTSIRVLGPLAGLLVFIYFVTTVLQNKRLRISVSPWIAFLTYTIIAILAMFITWPFLWQNPIANFIAVSRFMSDNPTNLSVLFGGEVYRAGELPRHYLPFMLATTLTEPVWLLFAFGIVIGSLKLFKRKTSVIAREAIPEQNQSLLPPFQGLAMTVRAEVVSLILILFWFLIIVAYVLIRRPAMYDGLRHFLFILPPIFIFAGFTFEFLIERIAIYWLRAALILALLTPGIVGIIQLHPYEYTYYNTFIGGTGQAFRQYETDYWLTCYKEAVENLEQTFNEPVNLYVHREAYIAAYYANENFNILDLRGALAEVQLGDYVLVNTRTNEDRKVFKEAPSVLQIGRGGAIFCMVKQIP